MIPSLSVLLANKFAVLSCVDVCAHHLSLLPPRLLLGRPSAALHLPPHTTWQTAHSALLSFPLFPAVITCSFLPPRLLLGRPSAALHLPPHTTWQTAHSALLSFPLFPAVITCSFLPPRLLLGRPSAALHLPPHTTWQTAHSALLSFPLFPAVITCSFLPPRLLLGRPSAALHLPPHTTWQTAHSALLSFPLFPAVITCSFLPPRLLLGRPSAALHLPPHTTWQTAHSALLSFPLFPAVITCSFLPPRLLLGRPSAALHLPPHTTWQTAHSALLSFPLFPAVITCSFLPPRLLLGRPSAALHLPPHTTWQTAHSALLSFPLFPAVITCNLLPPRLLLGRPSAALHLPPHTTWQTAHSALLSFPLFPAVITCNLLPPRLLLGRPSAALHLPPHHLADTRLPLSAPRGPASAAGVGSDDVGVQAEETVLQACTALASFLLASSSAFLVQHFTSLDATWQTPDFLSLPLEALQALLGSDDVGVQAEETVLEACLHWVRHHWPHDLSTRKEMLGRLAGSIRFPAMATAALHALITITPEADTPTLHALITEALWFKCSSFERQQQLIQDSLQLQQQHRRYQRRRQLSVCSEVLLQDCYMLQPGQAILLAGGTWLHGKLFSLKVMRVAAPVGGSDFGLFLQASQRSPTHDRVLDDSVTIEFTFLVKEHPSGQFVQQKQTASHTFKGLFRERGYRSLLNPWSEVVRDNGKYFRDGVMHLRADLRVLQLGEGLAPFD
ncbi:unnamed protein product [Closterium sp. Yama58-4]|nr:unnamed protein product [Closterium sp. Yama58-4]